MEVSGSTIPDAQGSIPTLDYRQPILEARSVVWTRWLITLTVILWTAVFISCCARTLAMKKDRSSVYMDFSSAGEHWMAGELLYQRGGVHEFRYSPLVAAFFVPFEMLPRRFGEFLWRSLNFTAFVGGLYYCCNIRIPVRFSTRQICGVFILCIPLAVGSLNNAQSNPLVLGLMLLSIGLASQKKWGLSSAAITLATCFKLYPIALGLLLVLMFPKKLAWRLAVCLAAAAVLPFVMQRAAYVIDQYGVWASYLISEDRQRGPITDWYRDFRAVWRVYIGTMSQRNYFLVELAAGMGIALLGLIGRVAKMPIPLLLAFLLSLSSCWMTALGPATESATYILIAPAVVWGLVLSQAESRARLRRIAYAAVFLLLFISQIAVNAGQIGRYIRDQLECMPLAATALLIVSALDLLARLKTRSAQPLINAAPTDDASQAAR